MTIIQYSNKDYYQSYFEQWSKEQHFFQAVPEVLDKRQPPSHPLDSTIQQLIFSTQTILNPTSSSSFSDFVSALNTKYKNEPFLEQPYKLEKTCEASHQSSIEVDIKQLLIYPEREVESGCTAEDVIKSLIEDDWSVPEDTLLIHTDTWSYVEEYYGECIMNGHAMIEEDSSLIPEEIRSVQEKLEKRERALISDSSLSVSDVERTVIDDHLNRRDVVDIWIEEQEETITIETEEATNPFDMQAWAQTVVSQMEVMTSLIDEDEWAQASVIHSTQQAGETAEAMPLQFKYQAMDYVGEKMVDDSHEIEEVSNVEVFSKSASSKMEKMLMNFFQDFIPEREFNCSMTIYSAEELKRMQKQIYLNDSTYSVDSINPISIVEDVIIDEKLSIEEYINEDSLFNSFASEISLSNVEINLPCLWYSELMHESRMITKPAREVSKQSAVCSSYLIDDKQREAIPTDMQEEYVNVETFNLEEQIAPLYSPQFMIELDRTIETHILDMISQKKSLERAEGELKSTIRDSSTVGCIHRYLALVDELPSLEEFSARGRSKASLNETHSDEPEYASHDKIESSKRDDIVLDSLDSFMAMKNSVVPSTTLKDKQVTKGIHLPPGESYCPFQENLVTQILKKSSILSLPDSIFPRQVTTLLLYNIIQTNSLGTIVWISPSNRSIEEEYILQSYILSGFVKVRLVTNQNIINVCSEMKSETVRSRVLFCTCDTLVLLIDRIRTFFSSCSTMVYSTSALLTTNEFKQFEQMSNHLLSITSANLHTVLVSQVVGDSFGQLRDFIFKSSIKQLVYTTDELDSIEFSQRQKGIRVSLEATEIGELLISISKIGAFLIENIHDVPDLREGIKFQDMDAGFYGDVFNKFNEKIRSNINTRSDTRELYVQKINYRRLVSLHVLRFLYDLLKESGIFIAYQYLEKLKQSKEYSIILDSSFSDIKQRIQQLYEESDDFHDHPKIQDFIRWIETEISASNKQKIIVITKYYSTIELLARVIHDKFPRVLVHIVQDEGESVSLINCNPHTPNIVDCQLIFIQKVTWRDEVVNRYFNDCSSVVDIEGVDFFSLEGFPRMYHQRKSFVTFSSVLHLSPNLDDIQKSWIETVLSATQRKRNRSDIVQVDELVHNGSVWDSKRLVDECLLDVLHQANRENNTKVPEKQEVTIVASDHIIQDVELINRLESHYRILISERDTSLFAQPDLVIGYRDCMIIEKIPLIGVDEFTDQLATKLLYLGVQYDSCWIIIRNFEEASYPDELRDQIQAVSVFSQSFTSIIDSLGIQTRILYTNDKEHCSEIIDYIARSVLSAEIKRRDCRISDNETNIEKFLSCFPSLSVFFVQQLLLAFPSLKDLYSHSVGDLVNIMELSNAEDISRIEKFYELLCNPTTEFDTKADSSECHSNHNPQSELDNSQLTVIEPVIQIGEDQDLNYSANSQMHVPSHSSLLFNNSSHVSSNSPMVFNLHDQLTIPDSMTRSSGTFSNPIQFIESCSYPGSSKSKKPMSRYQRSTLTSTPTRTKRTYSSRTTPSKRKFPF